MRKYRIIVAGTDITELHCVFSVTKSMSADPNKGTLKVYNLSESTRNKMSSGKEVIIEAGYQNGQYGLIYAGEIVVATNSVQNVVDRVTEITSQDGDRFLNAGFINVSYSKGQKSIDCLKQAVSAAGGKTDTITENAKKSVLPRGKAMFGSTADFLRQFAKNEDALAFVDDGMVCLVKAADPPRGQVVSLSPSSGLIGVPELTEDGIKGKSLLMPNFKLNGLVHIDNSFVEGATGTGIYKVIDFTHSGDSRGNEWYTSFNGIAQPGTTPVTGNSYSK